MVAVVGRARWAPAWATGSPVLAPLASAGYRRYWLSNAAAQAGDQLQIVALAVLVLNLTGSAAMLGAVLTVQAVPRTLLMLAGGVAADRFRPRTVLIATNLLQAALLAGLAALAAAGSLTLWPLYGFALLGGALYAFSVPAGQAIVPDLVPIERVRSAIALGSTTFNLTMSLVPPLAGVLVAQLGVAPVFALTALCFAAASLAMRRVRVLAAPPAQSAGASAWANLREGLSVVRQEPVLLVATVSATVFSLGFSGVTLVGVPAFAKLGLGAGDGGVGVLFGALGAGSLLGALAVGAATRIRRQGLVASLALAGLGLGLAAVATASSLAPAAALLFLAGLIKSACGVNYIAIVQTHSAPAVRGRVMALFMLGVMGLAPASVGLGGLAAELLGPRGVFLLGGAVIVAAGLYALSRPAFRRVG
jgi:MFS family permease